MRALSIRQPWVELIFRGDEPIEYRTWKTNHRGPLLIHASRTVEYEDVEDLGWTAEALPTGALVGVVEVTNCTEVEGGYAWHLAKPKRFPKPIPYKGAAGIFVVLDEGVATSIQQARSR